jgi:hypothetical protein
MSEHSQDPPLSAAQTSPPQGGREAPAITGGCQCGALRYRAEDANSTNPHLCHCRMCQKAAGNYFMPLAGADHARKDRR